MKFGKRLGAEAARGWLGTYLDYKECKRAIRQDVEAQDAAGSAFEAVVGAELQKIGAFYAEKEAELEAMASGLQGADAPALAAFRAEVLQLRKYAVLNSTAVVKAVKKRNRHLAAAVPAAAPLRAVELLSQQHWFTSPRLAALSTRAEVLAQDMLPREAAAQALEAYECPICLGVLQSPVLLTCAHRFCWGCLLAHCATSQEAQQRQQSHAHAHGHAAGGACCEGGKPGAKLLSAIAHESAASRAATYGCPVCRKPHILDLDRLQVDQTLTDFIKRLQLRQRPASAASAPAAAAAAAAAAQTAPASTPLPCRRQSAESEVVTLRLAPAPGGLLGEAGSGSETEPEAEAAEEQSEAAAAVLPEAEVEAQESSSAHTPPLLPPQSEAMCGRLTVVLDLDGTLISSYTPRRAPSLPPGLRSYVVGKGAKLNPHGVLVVERPELKAFFDRLSQFAEVVLFTAGLEDYAAPICAALERHYGCFTAKLYRPATVGCEAYPCVKDLSRLGRDLKRTVLVDDTPLAFLWQPNNGVPIFNFRGDVDDRVLPEAILPLLEQLSAAPDVRPLLQRRFDMPRWLASHGIACSPRAAPKPAPAAPAPAAAKQASPVQRRLDLQPRRPPPPAPANGRGTLLLTDFDNTLTDCDAGERLVGALAPELAPMLASLQQPANFVPVTNAVLAEMGRRGIGRARLEAALAGMAAEIPAPSLEMLRWAGARAGLETRVLSDCNALFIGRMLQGAGVAGLVREVVTNAAAWEAAAAPAAAAAATPAWAGAFARTPPAAEAGERLVVQPRHSGQPHACTLCPANLCKGLELSSLRKQHGYSRIIYCGDGANDLCPALALGPGDAVLARAGFALDALIAKRAAGGGGQKVTAAVHTWQTHQQLFALVRRLAA